MIIAKLLEEKGHLSLASLTVTEFIGILDAYKDGSQNEPSSEREVVLKRKGLVKMEVVLKEIGISRSTFFRMRKRGIVPEYTDGGHPKYSLEEVRRSLAKNAITVNPSGV
jgi:hypothetical protein